MTSPRRALKTMGRRPAKRLGQHFLVNPRTAVKIAGAIQPGPGDWVVDIGAGFGALTEPLLQSGARVMAVEIDPDLALFLGKKFSTAAAAGLLSTICMDILELDLPRLSSIVGKKLKLAGNLPYNISSPLLFKVMESAQYVERAVFMLQQEVAQRLLARPGSKEHGILSVMAAYHCERSRLMRLKPTQFYPQPRVSSMVVQLQFRPWPDTLEVDPGWLFTVVKAAFGHRRKTLKNSLRMSGLPGLTAEVAEKAARQSGIDPGCRPQSLALEEFLKLAKELASRLEQ
ncbi:MAG: ribosomal RNA small subunit methyltransferase A [Deltaproteobacteria bacterium]|nr:ribosomal RNA small subunit methyltransferase A [Deltaproteobacteria bacterium]